MEAFQTHKLSATIGDTDSSFSLCKGLQSTPALSLRGCTEGLFVPGSEGGRRRLCGGGRQGIRGVVAAHPRLGGRAGLRRRAPMPLRHSGSHPPLPPQEENVCVQPNGL
eukprot:scaffold220188_cov22-Prasinocladus_malaysianus.AAC.1